MSSAQAQSSLPEDVLSPCLEAWKSSEGVDSRSVSLLRLSILRDLLRSVHAEKSRRLAARRKPEAQNLRRFETRLEELRCAASFEGGLVALVESSTPLRRKTRVLPEALVQAIGREKLDRYDRQWETAIAAEAATQGWNFWRLENWVEVGLADEWNRTLAERLWPHGLVLFVESAAMPAAGTSSSWNGTAPPGVSLWKGVWVVLLHPKFADPSELSLDFSRWPGATESPPEPASWKLLFATRRG